MDIQIRQGEACDSTRIGELSYMASDGAVEYLFHDLVPNVSALQVLCDGLKRDVYPHTYKSALVAHDNTTVVGMALSYPARFHCITEALAQFLPSDRLAHFNEFYNTRVEGSYLLDALCVDAHYRGQGIGAALLKATQEKAIKEGFSVLSLIVFADNVTAIQFYEGQGFKTQKQIRLAPHEKIPHEGGCLLMSQSL